MKYEKYKHWEIPASKKITCKICHMGDHTGLRNQYGDRWLPVPSDLDSDIHTGITVGNGKQVYWMMIWHSYGNVTVYNRETLKARWLSGDTEITIHFK